MDDFYKLRVFLAKHVGEEKANSIIEDLSFVLCEDEPNKEFADLVRGVITGTTQGSAEAAPTHTRRHKQTVTV